ncbi:hypothetical protein RE943_48280 (plasmid) [Prescottella equi]|uniref:Putative integral membrane protein n=1 Tax=Rhodococcus hoagii TaxID=43767 RepID=A0A0F6YS66_RHOHA|nr:hypothetical protein [Prescottella equi]AKF16055.1 putative integral membrane protein [Prescottella equi]ARX59704.1 putative integral membrane protein [Prescottella equi]ARX59850.1 putative integral membrane protein [Prescottella equi]ARX59997.1 putative integral membrane protein [Prescottella equi]BCN46652.1 hypothetical protein RE9414_49320 [Prescottella equi]
MFPSSSADVAVSHFSNWSTINWVAAFTVLGLAFLAAWFAVGSIVDDALGADGPLWVGVLAGIVAVVMQAVTLWLTVRHIEQFKWAVTLALAVVGATALVARNASRAAASARRGYRASEAPALTVAVPAGISGVIAAGVLIGDGVTRAAAAIPVAVGTFVLLIVAGAGLLWMHANSR